MTRELTNSMRSCWNACHRKYKFTYIDLYKKNRTSDALLFGTAFHAMMEVYWAKMLGDASNDYSGDILTIANDYATANDDAYTAQTLLALFNGYAEHYITADREQYGCVFVEGRFDTPLLNPNSNGKSLTFHLSGKLDGLLVEKKTGIPVILEHKTTSQDIDPTSDYWMKLPIDGQVSGYYLGAQSMGYNAESCLYDVIRKPTMRPSESIPELDENGLKIVVDDATGERVAKKDGSPRQSAGDGMHMLTRAETPEEWFSRISADIASNPGKYYQRMTIVRNANDLEDYLFDMWGLSKELLEAEKTGHFSRNPNGCAQYGTCEFFGVCTGAESLDDTILYTKKEKANEEL